MVRWAPGADGRLRMAALELFAEHGYEQTTVAQIAERAGVTSRTFFRYYADKREVLFGGGAALSTAMVDALETAPTDAGALDQVRVAIDELTAWLGGDHGHSSTRNAVISAHPELQERELIKMAGWARLLADRLRERGVPDAQAGLAAEAGIAVFRTAFERWVNGDGKETLEELVDDGFTTLRALS
jgi:AcrR family transcriptional regulator